MVLRSLASLRLIIKMKKIPRLFPFGTIIHSPAVITDDQEFENILFLVHALFENRRTLLITK